jgi:hypothetical protein
VVVAGVFAVGLASLALLPPARDGRRLFVWVAAGGSLAYPFVTPNDTDFRLELVAVPFAALGLAALATRLREGTRHGGSSRPACS